MFGCPPADAHVRRTCRLRLCYESRLTFRSSKRFMLDSSSASCSAMLVGSCSVEPYDALLVSAGVACAGRLWEYHGSMRDPCVQLKEHRAAQRPSRACILRSTLPWRLDFAREELRSVALPTRRSQGFVWSECTLYTVAVDGHMCRSHKTLDCVHRTQGQVQFRLRRLGVHAGGLQFASSSCPCSYLLVTSVFK